MGVVGWLALLVGFVVVFLVLMSVLLWLVVLVGVVFSISGCRLLILFRLLMVGLSGVVFLFLVSMFLFLVRGGVVWVVWVPLWLMVLVFVGVVLLRFGGLGGCVVLGVLVSRLVLRLVAWMILRVV